MKHNQLKRNEPSQYTVSKAKALYMRVHGYAMSHLWSSRAADRLTKSLPAVLPHQRVVSTARTTSTLLLQGSMPDETVMPAAQYGTRLVKDVILICEACCENHPMG